MTMKSIFLSVSLAVAGLAYASPADAFEPFIGEIREFGTNFCPRGWAGAEGQLLAVNSNTALFSLYGTIYGGDGRSTFGLPDLRGRASIHSGNGAGLTSFREGQRGGAERVTVALPNLPNHTHRAGVRTVDEIADTPTPRLASFTTQGMINAFSTVPPGDIGNSPRFMQPNTVWVEGTGGSQPISYRSPYLTTRKCVSLLGIYPSRS